MTINDITNGPERAQNSSKQTKTTIQTPDNGSYQQSLYVVALAQYTGREGLASPATDVRDGIEYTFDFYDPADGVVVKVFKSNQLAEYEKYTQYLGGMFIIIDVDDHPGCQPAKCSWNGERHIILPRELGEKLHDTDVTYIYFRGYLCAYIGNAKDGRSDWLVLEPFGLHETDNESDCGEEDED